MVAASGDCGHAAATSGELRSLVKVGQVGDRVDGTGHECDHSPNGSVPSIYANIRSMSNYPHMPDTDPGS